MSTPNEVLRFALASSAAYDDAPAGELARAGLRLIEGHSEEATDSQAIAVRDDATLVFAFRGTSSVKDALIDAEVRLGAFDAHRLADRQLVHEGFRRAWISLRVWVNQVSQANQDWPREIIVCGHSLGGAIATLAAVDLWAERPIRAFTYGSPRVGLGSFAAGYNRAVTETTRVVHDQDVVPRVPGMPYDHVDGLLHLDDHGREIGSARGFLRGLLGFGRRFFADVDFEALRDHHMDGYTAACHAHALVQAA